MLLLERLWVLDVFGSFLVPLLAMELEQLLLRPDLGVDDFVEIFLVDFGFLVDERLSAFADAN